MRTTLALFILALFSVMPASARDHDANFLIKRAGKVIGFHHVDISNTADGMVVETTIRMRVKFGPIPLFRFDHKAVEKWRDGRLYSLSSETNNNGDDDYVRLTRIADGYEIVGSGFSGVAPASAMPSSYWNKSLVETNHLISTQTGEIIDVTVAELGQTMAPHKRDAEHYRIVGTLALDLWYDGPKWVGSQFTIDGEELIYELAPSSQDYASLTGATAD